MKFAALLARLDRLQQTVRFKAIASVVIAALAVAGTIALIVAANAPGAGERLAERAAQRAEQREDGLPIGRGPIDAAAQVIDSLMLTIKPIRGRPAGADPDAPVAQPARSSSGGAVVVAGLISIVAGGLIAAVWLGIGLSLLGLLLVGWGLAWPLMIWPPTSGGDDDQQFDQ